jgi:hypothetical protein
MSCSKLDWRVALSALVIVAGCSTADRPTGPTTKPDFAISDAVHESGTAGFYFLPPMVAQPSVSGTFDADIAALNPAIAICDVTSGPDSNCGDAGGTAAAIVFTSTSTPAITLDPTTPQYQVNWDTKGTSFTAGHAYRIHIVVMDACGNRKALGFADVLLTTTPGQVKQLASGETIVLQDGRTLPIHFRVETQAAVAHDCWTSATPMPTPRAYASVAAVNGKVYAIGGFDPANNPTPMSTVEAYDPSTNVWSTKASLLTPRNEPGVGVVNGIIYVVGGTDNVTPLGTVEAYDPTTDAWTTKAPMPTPRYALAVSVVNGVLYAVGGNGDNVNLSTVEAYDPATNMWTTKTPRPTPTGYATGGGALNGLVYAVGGTKSPCCGESIATVEAYDPATNLWSTKAPLLPVPDLNWDIGVVSMNNLLYALMAGDPPNSIEDYDPAANMWTYVGLVPTPRIGFRVGGLDGLIYTVGGYGVNRDPNPVGTVEVYHP